MIGSISKTGSSLGRRSLWLLAAMALACAALAVLVVAPRAYASQESDAAGGSAIAAASANGGAFVVQASAKADGTIGASKYALLAKDGRLYPCNSKGKKLAALWDGTSSKLPGKVTGVFVAANAKKVPTQVKYSVVGKKIVTYTASLGALKSITNVTFLLKGGKNACKAVSDKAFMSMKRLKTIKNFDKTKVASLGAWAFGYSSLKSIALPKTLKSMGESAFAYCKSLASVKGLGKTALKSVSKWGFYGCKALKAIALPKACKVVKDSAFSDCAKLAKATLGAKTATLGARAFYGCASLKTIALPKACKGIGTYCFANCSKLKTTTLNASRVVVHKDGDQYNLSGSFANTPIAAAQSSATDNGARIYVPASLVVKYQSSAPWAFCKGVFRAIG